MIYKFKRQHEDTLKKVLKEIKIIDPNNDLSKLDWDEAWVEVEWKATVEIFFDSKNLDQKKKKNINGILTSIDKLIEYIYGWWREDVYNFAYNLVSDMKDLNHIFVYKIIFYKGDNIVKEFDVIKEKPLFKS